MKTLKLISLMLILGIHAAFAVMPEGGTGGNGQLVVIPQQGKKPLPYEIARSWDTGVYRNFYKMPGVNGSFEPRTRFNKAYGVHAIEWLKIIKEVNNEIYSNLVAAAKSTTIRIMDNLILWEHEAYPKDGTDYKKFEKAAFFNGEIIFSIPIMDNLGPLENILTKEENQGFVVIHELINAAYTGMKIADKLILGELISNIKIMKWNKQDFLTELLNRNFDAFKFTLHGEDFKTVIDVLNELGPEAVKKQIHLNLPIDVIEKQGRIILESKSVKEGVLNIYPTLSGSIFERLKAVRSILADLCALNLIGQGDFNNVYNYELLQELDQKLLIKIKWEDLPTETNQDVNVRNKFMKQQRLNHIGDHIHFELAYLRRDSAANFESGLRNIFWLVHNFEGAFYGEIKKSYYINYIDPTHRMNTQSVTETLKETLDELRSKGQPDDRAFATELENIYREIKLKLGVIDFWPYGSTFDDNYPPRYTTRLFKNMKLRFIKNRDQNECKIGELRFNDETYLITSISHTFNKIKLKVISSRDETRLNKTYGFKIKDGNDSQFPNNCSVAVMNK